MNEIILSKVKQASDFIFGSCIKSKQGMEMVQVAILVAIAIAIGLLFKDKIMDFVNDAFSKLDSSGFADY